MLSSVDTLDTLENNGVALVLHTELLKITSVYTSVFKKCVLL